MIFDVISLIADFVGSKKAAKGAKKEAAEQAHLEGLTTTERLRQLGIEERTMYGQTLAGYASGGVLATTPTLAGSQSPMIGSPGTVIAEQKKEFGLERDITEQVGATKVQQALTRGKNVATAYKWQGYSNLASGVSDILSKAAMLGGI